MGMQIYNADNYRLKNYVIYVCGCSGSIDIAEQYHQPEQQKSGLEELLLCFLRDGKRLTSSTLPEMKWLPTL
jgi:hypothetical protein